MHEKCGICFKIMKLVLLVPGALDLMMLLGLLVHEICPSRTLKGLHEIVSLLYILDFEKYFGSHVYFTIMDSNLLFITRFSTCIIC